MAVTGILENIRGCYYAAKVLGYDPKADMVVKLKAGQYLKEGRSYNHCITNGKLELGAQLCDKFCKVLEASMTFSQLAKACLNPSYLLQMV